MYGHFEKDCLLKENKSVNYAQEGDKSSPNNSFLSYGKIESTVKDVWYKNIYTIPLFEIPYISFKFTSKKNKDKTSL